MQLCWNFKKNWVVFKIEKNVKCLIKVSLLDLIYVTKQQIHFHMDINMTKLYIPHKNKNKVMIIIRLLFIQSMWHIYLLMITGK